MARVLIVVPPLHGHLNPTLALGAELARHGHDVTWAGHADFLDAHLPAEADREAVSPRLPESIAQAVSQQTRPLRGMSALRFLWADFILPLAEDMRPGLERLVDAQRPDLVIADQQALAAVAVAESRGIPWVTSATTTGELSNPADAMPQVEAWRRLLVAGFLTRAGVPVARAAGLDVRFSPHLVLVFSTTLMVGEDRLFPEHYAFVGPAIRPRSDADDFPWEQLAPDRPLVLVSLGSLNGHAGARFFGAAAEALGSLDVQGVMVAQPELVPDPPANVLVRPWVPQLALLERTDAVVTHAGQNTVSECLTAGVPMVLAPIRDDQPTIADEVVAAGAGIRVPFGRVGGRQLADALDAVLHDPAYGGAAQRIQEAGRRAGGAAEAVRRVEALLSRVTEEVPA
jgi:MGT family glycosyltransferase